MEGSRQVLKFGGTSVGSGAGIQRVASIIRHHVRDSGGMFPVVVVSAMSGVTDPLPRHHSLPGLAHYRGGRLLD